jgi:hypothetical protein
MNCPNCHRQNPADAKFCIYCAAQMTPQTPEVDTAPKPAVGPTVRLNPAPAPSYTLPAEPQPAPAPAPQPKPRSRAFDDAPTGAVFLIGLGVLILTGNFFPGILLLLGVTGYMSEMRRGRRERALQPLVFFGGLTLLFATGFFFPGIFFLLGAMYLLGRGGHRGWHRC